MIKPLLHSRPDVHYENSAVLLMSYRQRFGTTRIGGKNGPAEPAAPALGGADAYPGDEAVVAQRGANRHGREAVSRRAPIDGAARVGDRYRLRRVVLTRERWGIHVRPKA
jgi:hypothetical protein